MNPEILPFAQAASLLNAHLEALQNTSDALLMDYLELRLQAEPTLIQRDGRLLERLQGEHVPRRLRFHRVEMVRQDGPYEDVAALPADASARSLQGMVYWRAPDGVARYLLFANSTGLLLFTAEQVEPEARPGDPSPVDITRDYSSPPLLPVGPVPRPADLHTQFGGDPVTIHLDGQTYDRRLFVGGVREQPEARPGVDVVLNLGEFASAWGEGASADRWNVRGEGDASMDVDTLRDEAQWVTERLRKGQSVLVHCAAGFNRSVTVVCATLMQLEGLSAVAALDRVREYHPWARPDGHHWLKLKWLAQHP